MCGMTRFVRVKIHSYSLSVCSVELRRNDEIVRVSVSVSVCPNYALNNQWQSDIVVVFPFVLLKCSVRQSVTKSICPKWHSYCLSVWSVEMQCSSVCYRVHLST